jgi:hypothetical protein
MRSKVKGRLAVSLDPNISAEINHALPLRHCGVKSTEDTLRQRIEDWCLTVKSMGESRGQVGIDYTTTTGFIYYCG